MRVAGYEGILPFAFATHPDVQLNAWTTQSFDLMRHYHDRCAIIEAAAGPERPIRRDTVEEARQVPPADQAFQQPLIDPNGWSLLNDESENVWLTPETWARRFETLYLAATPAQRMALREHNAEAIEEASRSIGAEIIFTDLFAADAEPSPAAPRPSPAPTLAYAAPEPVMPRPAVFPAGTPQPGTATPVLSQPAAARPVLAGGGVAGGGVVEADLTVVPPRGISGGVDKPAYLARLKASIAAHVNDADDAVAWMEVNEPLYRGLGAVVGLEVLKALAARKRALGIPAPEAMGK